MTSAVTHSPLYPRRFSAWPTSARFSSPHLDQLLLWRQTTMVTTHHRQQNTVVFYCAYLPALVSSHHTISAPSPLSPTYASGSRDAVEVEREHQAQCHCKETCPVTVCVSSAQFNYYQPYLFTLDVCSCFLSVEQEPGRGGDLVCVVCLLPCSGVNFVFNKD